MDTVMVGEWHGVLQGHLGFSNQEGGPRLIQFEFQGGGSKKLNFESISEFRSSPHQNRHPGRIQSPFWMFFI